jgi:hypothetical protein
MLDQQDSPTVGIVSHLGHVSLLGTDTRERLDAGA